MLSGALEAGSDGSLAAADWNAWLRVAQLPCVQCNRRETMNAEPLSTLPAAKHGASAFTTPRGGEASCATDIFSQTALVAGGSKQWVMRGRMSLSIHMGD